MIRVFLFTALDTDFPICYTPLQYAVRCVGCALQRISVPIYEYSCADCKIEFDKLVKLSDAKVVQDCPECGGGGGRFS